MALPVFFFPLFPHFAFDSHPKISHWIRGTQTHSTQSTSRSFGGAGCRQKRVGARSLMNWMFPFSSTFFGVFLLANERKVFLVWFLVPVRFMCGDISPAALPPLKVYIFQSPSNWRSPKYNESSVAIFRYTFSPANDLDIENMERKKNFPDGDGRECGMWSSNAAGWGFLLNVCIRRTEWGRTHKCGDKFASQFPALLNSFQLDYNLHELHIHLLTLSAINFSPIKTCFRQC